jgi:hypothetical protein
MESNSSKQAENEMANIEIRARKVEYRNNISYTNDILVNGKVLVRAVSDRMAQELVNSFGDKWGRAHK